MFDWIGDKIGGFFGGLGGLVGGLVRFGLIAAAVVGGVALIAKFTKKKVGDDFDKFLDEHDDAGEPFENITAEQENALEHAFASGNVASTILGKNGANVIGEGKELYDKILGPKKTDPEGDGIKDRLNNKYGILAAKWAQENGFKWDDTKDEMLAYLMESKQLVLTLDDPRVAKHRGKDDITPDWTPPNDKFIKDHSK